MNAIATDVDAIEVPKQANIRKVIFASSVGTLFEWYDFYLYGSLAVFFGGLFFPPGNEQAALLASLATFGAGFGVRPLGAAGLRPASAIGSAANTPSWSRWSSWASPPRSSGFLPTYEQIGMWAPALLVFLRLAQGLALGGEYGGAATYVAEHVPDDRRGYYTSYHPDHRDARLLHLARRDRRRRRLYSAPRSSGPSAGASRSCCRSSCSGSRSTSA